MSREKGYILDASPIDDGRIPIDDLARATLPCPLEYLLGNFFLHHKNLLYKQTVKALKG